MMRNRKCPRCKKVKPIQALIDALEYHGWALCLECLEEMGIIVDCDEIEATLP